MRRKVLIIEGKQRREKEDLWYFPPKSYFQSHRELGILHCIHICRRVYVFCACTPIYCLYMPTEFQVLNLHHELGDAGLGTCTMCTHKTSARGTTSEQAVPLEPWRAQLGASPPWEHEALGCKTDISFTDAKSSLYTPRLVPTKETGGEA